MATLIAAATTPPRPLLPGPPAGRFDPDLWDRLDSEADAVLGDVGDGPAPDHNPRGARPRGPHAAATPCPPAGRVRESVVDVTAGGYRIPRHAHRGPSTSLDATRRIGPTRSASDPDRHLDLPPPNRPHKAAWVLSAGGPQLHRLRPRPDRAHAHRRPPAQRLRLAPVDTTVSSPAAHARCRRRAASRHGALNPGLGSESGRVGARVRSHLHTRIGGSGGPSPRSRRRVERGQPAEW